MRQIVLAGVKPYDGAYDLDLDREFTTREWGWIKRFAGYLPLEVDERALGDPEFVCVVAVIAMHRAGRIQPAEAAGVYARLEDAPFGTGITVTADTEPPEEAGSPPTPPSSNGNAASSGQGSPTSSATPTAPAGARGSATSASGPATSAT